MACLLLQAGTPKIKRSLLRNLGRCLFVEKKEHILICGPAVVDKIHLVQALGHAACPRCYDVLFVKAVKMLRSPHASRADHSWERRIRKFLRSDLLIPDDLRLTGLTSTQAQDFYEIVAERHLNSSMIITSNRPPPCLRQARRLGGPVPGSGHG